MKKGGQNKDMNSVFNTIIKKENGVNPFLTVMNFKISYKTWLKHSRKRFSQNLDETSSIDYKRYLVPVDIEEVVEYTSEEEEEVFISLTDKMMDFQRRASNVFNTNFVRKTTIKNNNSQIKNLDDEI